MAETFITENSPLQRFESIQWFQSEYTLWFQPSLRIMVRNNSWLRVYEFGSARRFHEPTMEHPFGRDDRHAGANREQSSSLGHAGVRSRTNLIDEVCFFRL